MRNNANFVMDRCGRVSKAEYTDEMRVSVVAVYRVFSVYL